MHPTPDSVVQGYRLIRPIGSGGFGEVWLARSEATGVWKAVKWIEARASRHLDQELGALRRYSQEVGGSRSSHLVPVEHVSVIDGSLMLVMPLADGTTEDPSDASWAPLTLRTFLDRHTEDGSWFNLEEIRRVVSGVLSGAVVLAEKGLQHRDIKPENILFLGGEPALADFGLVTEDQTQVSMRGTPHHAAPSWYLESGGNADQWGIAILLYQLLTGNAPDKMGKPRYFRPAPGMGALSGDDLKEWRRLHHLSLRATSEEPKERFQSPESFKAAVEISSETSTPKTRVGTAIAGLSVSLLVLVVMGGFLIVGNQPSGPLEKSPTARNSSTPAPSASSTPRPEWMDHPKHIYSSAEVVRINSLVAGGDNEGMRKLNEENEARYRGVIKRLPPGAGFSWVMEQMQFPEKSREIGGNERNTSSETNEIRPTPLSSPDPLVPLGSSPAGSPVPMMRRLLSSFSLMAGITAHAAVDPSGDVGNVAERLMVEATARLHPQQILIALCETSTGRILTVAYQGDGKDPHDLNSLVYEPASSIKPIVVASALECGAVKETTRLNTREAEFAGNQIHDPIPADQLTPTEIIARKNNVGMARIVERLSDQQLYDGLKSFDFGISPGYLPPTSEWVGETKTRLSIGQSLTVTPMQLLWAYNVLANEGVIPGEKRSVVSAGIAKTITQALTGTLSNIPGLSVAGTTSTSRAVKGKEYVDGRYVTQCIGYFPAEHPRYIAQVVVDGARVPTEENTGALVAEPLFRKFVEESAPILGLAKGK